MHNRNASLHSHSSTTRQLAIASAMMESPIASAFPMADTGCHGCISDISSDSIHGCEHDYAAAMKTYGGIYERYQSYLMPRDQLLPHDYDLVAKVAPTSSHLGCLDQELLESTVPSDDVSDDEIETCGYLGWLHH